MRSIVDLVLSDYGKVQWGSGDKDGRYAILIRVTTVLPVLKSILSEILEDGMTNFSGLNTRCQREGKGIRGLSYPHRNNCRIKLSYSFHPDRMDFVQMQYSVKQPGYTLQKISPSEVHAFDI